MSCIIGAILAVIVFIIGCMFGVFVWLDRGVQKALDAAGPDPYE